jgi:hypothetical protein
MTTDEIRWAEADMEKTLARLQKLSASGAPIGMRQTAETVYAQAYQTLVRLGLRPQIRRKYRTTGK